MRILLLLLFTISAFAEAPYGLSSRPSFPAFNGGKLPATAPAVSGDWATSVAFPNLTFLNPLGILPLPGTNKLVVWGREGYVWSFDNVAEVSEKTLILDLHNVCQGWDDQGLLALAFHPDFIQNSYVYLWYNRVKPGDSILGDMNNRPPWREQRQRLARFTYNPDTGLLDPASEMILIDQTDYSPWHNGGGMFFHPIDGFLYLTNGNDANAGGGNDQRLDGGLFGCVIRIDVDKRGGSTSHAPTKRALGESSPHWPEAYYVPNDNPFVGVFGALEEIFALGLRSPHRMTVDPVSQRIFIGDVGDGSKEEIDVIEPGEKGLNFQYNVIEGYAGDLTTPYMGINKRPIVDYPHGGDGSAVIGGYVYRGKQFPELVGKYIFGDNTSNNIWYLDETARTALTPAVKIPLTTMPKGDGPNSGNDYTGISSFGYDADGELLMCQLSSLGGRIYKLERQGAGTSQMPLTLSETGVFSNHSTLAVGSGIIAYEVNSALWSDGAHKKRWFGVPSDKTIDFTPTGEWSFPEGTLFIKHFELTVDERVPANTKRLETRILVRDTAGGVYGGSYKWRDDGTDADLVIQAQSEDVQITAMDGSNRTQSWFYPGRQDCLSCHTHASGGVLGVNTQQSNRAHVFEGSGVSDNQLRAWNHAGYFSKAINERAIASYKKLVSVDDTSASLERRARSYLDANCAHCHRPGGVPALWDARIETPLAKAGIVNVKPLNNLGDSNARIIASKDKGHSVLAKRMSTATDVYRMPPIAKNVVDEAAVGVIQQWIASLPPAPEPPSLPAPWVHQDIGTVQIEGDTLFQSGMFNLSASGNDIWDYADAFQFAYRAVYGDVQMVARVRSVSDTNEWTKAGVMFRESLDASSKHAMMVITPQNGAAFQRRTETAGESDHTGTDASAPYWVKIRRAGDTLIGSISQNGSSWTEVDRVVLDTSKTGFIGLCLTSHDGQSVASASFDQVSFVGQTAISLPPPQAQVGVPLLWNLSILTGSITGVTGLPDGLSFDPKTGAVTGTPNGAGSFSLKLSSSAQGKQFTQRLTLSIDPFPVALTGSFAGIIPRDPMNQNLGGLLNFQVTSSGVTSGKVTLTGLQASRTFKSRFPTPLTEGSTSEVSIPLGGTPEQTLTVTIAPEGDSFGALLSSGSAEVGFSGRKTLTDTGTLAGRYNMRLSVPSDAKGDPSIPQGAGWILASVSKTGTVILQGKLADGAPVSVATVLENDYTVPLLKSLYAGYGSLLGDIALDGDATQSGRTLSGVLEWQKLYLGSNKDVSYPAFDLRPEVYGRFTSLSLLSPVFGSVNNTDPNAEILFTEGGIENAAQANVVSQSFLLTASNRAVFAQSESNPCKTSFSIDSRSGAFDGSFKLLDGKTVRNVRFSGIFIPGETKATGWFLLPPLSDADSKIIRSGLVEIYPR